MGGRQSWKGGNLLFHSVNIHVMPGASTPLCPDIYPENAGKTVHILRFCEYTKNNQTFDLYLS